jgi:serine/threonine protein phosphatase PrpC/ribosomal protein L40E
MTACPQCGSNLSSSAKFCSKCGHTLVANGSAAKGTATTNQGLPSQPQAAKTKPLPPSGQTAEPAPTQRLSAPSLFTRLADGDLIHGDRFEIATCVEQTPALNTYVVVDRKIRRCRRCGAGNPHKARFCETCGEKLETDSIFLMQESFAEPTLAAAMKAAKLGICHANLVNIYESFSDRPINRQERFYVLKDPVLVDIASDGIQSAKRLSELPAASPAQALTWAIVIGNVLDTLASVGAYLPDLTLAQILLVGSDVRLDVMESVKSFTPPQAEKVAAHHVQSLARLLQEMARGSGFTPPQLAILNEAQTADRYATATEFVAALQHAQQAGPVTAPIGEGGALQVVAGKLTDLGLVREINEDSLLSMELDQFHNSVNAPLRLYAIADGMGGHAAGEVASKLALNQLSRALLDQVQATIVANTQLPRFDYTALLKQAAQSAAKAVYDQGQRTRSDMGTTLVAALVDVAGARAHIVNVGDSRIYKINAQGMRQISKDHSMVQLLIDKQQLTPAEARHHPQANLIYRTLGERANVEIDTYEEPLAAGDMLLLCTDGLSGLVEDSQMHTVVTSSSSPQAACAKLVELAKAGGGHDNITVIVVQLTK